MKNYTSRLERLEAQNFHSFPDILALINAGCHYNELDNDQRTRYAEYWGVTRDALEAVEIAVIGSLNFPLERKEPHDVNETISFIENQIFLNT